MPESTPRGWSLRSSLTLLGVIACVLTVVMVTAGTLALIQLRDARERVVSRIDPAVRDATVLTAALINQETGVRGYVIGREPDLLEPYERGRRDEDATRRALADAAADPALQVGGDLAEITAAAEAWHTRFAEPTIAAIRAERAPPVSAEQGKVLFDRVRASLADLQGDLDAASIRAREDLRSAASTLQWVLALVGLGLLVMLAVLALGLRRVVIRPLSTLAGEVRRVSGGDFGLQVRTAGPREIVQLGDDVDTMRRRILDELVALREASERMDQQARDLERSNTELEQFAYVASHDLQEPLRKVASFTQLLERRYSGQLDERADQYIAFAVDGAKRMQVLINDLLAFSRVGRLTREHVEFEFGDLVRQAVANLSLVIEETDTEVTVEEMPRISGDLSLLTGVVQNLLSNGIKFRGDEPPRIHVGVRDAGDEWEFCVADNGIGIDPEYSERIFVIFQRLHSKDAYPGTGIGLAMCRKIIEYHGGRIWLDTEVSAGTTFRFTLPKLQSSEEAEEETPAVTATEEPETTG